MTGELPIVSRRVRFGNRNWGSYLLPLALVEESALALPADFGDAFQTQTREYGRSHRFRKKGWNRVAHLIVLAAFAPAECEPVRKTLEAGALSHRQPPPSPVGQAHAEHITRGAVQVSACDRSARTIQMQIARANALRSDFVPLDIGIHAWRQEF